MPGMIANVLVPIFFGLALGYFAGWRGAVDNKNVSGLNSFLVTYALPAALFLATAQTPRHMFAYHGKLFTVLALSMVVMFGMVLTIQQKLFKFTLADSAAATLTLSLPNYVAVGLPLFVGLYGPQGTATAAVAIVCGNLIPVPMSLLLLEAGGAQASSADALRRFGQALWRSLTKPMVLGPLIGVCLSLAGCALPPVLVRSLGIFAQTVAGVALFVTGLVLSREPVSLGMNVSAGLVLKLVAHPLLTLALASLLKAPAQVARDAVLLTACPGGFLGVLFGVAYNARSREASSLLLLSSVLSAVTLSLVILLLPLIQ